MKIHTLASTEIATTACFIDDNVNHGDLLVIPSEDVIGVADIWPFAITKNNGCLETLRTEQSFKKKLVLSPQLIEAYTLYVSLIEPGTIHIK